MSKQVVVSELPTCDFCPEKARYDSHIRVFGGVTWAKTCPEHWRIKRISSRLGTGFGQRLVLASEGTRVKDSEPLPKLVGVKI
jgi:hypothetical protein